MRSIQTLAVMFLSAFVLCCAHPASVQAPQHDVAWGEYERLVRVVVLCDFKTYQLQMTGSGVRVGGTTILTANHVVLCVRRDKDQNIVDRGELLNIHVFDEHAKEYEAALEGSSQQDVARLRAAKIAPLSPVEIVPAVTGDNLCAVFAWPDVGRRCGELWPSPDVTGGLHIDFVAEHGNSGAGVWTEQGQLAGIVVFLHWCRGTEGDPSAPNQQVCTAGATALASRRWIAAP